MIEHLQSTKPINHIPSTKKRRLEHHVIWLKQSSGRLEKIGKTALLVTELALAALFLVTIPIIVKYAEWLKKIHDKKVFEELASQAIPPDQELVINIKSATQTFNHTHQFVIKDAIIWMRPLHSKGEWAALRLDGDKEGKIPCSIDCDGANLIVLDQDNEVHYKKVIREYRGSELGKEGEERVYYYIDKAMKMNWKDKWFSLPVAYAFHNLVFGKRLKINPEARAWAISHRGRYNDFLEDAAGFKFFPVTGVTTLYVLGPDGKKIEKFDPWSTNFGAKDTYFPETQTSTYTALNLKAASSTVMLIGYERTKGEDVERLVVKTKLADLDSEGCDPFLNYTYKHEEGVENSVHVLPMSSWESHPFNLEEGEKVTKQISIIQTGAGNAERGLIVAGTKWIDGELKSGCYFKKLEDQDWEFVEDDTLELDELLETEIPAEGDFHPNVKEYQNSLEDAFAWKPLQKPIKAGILTQKPIAKPTGNVTVESFGDNSHESLLNLTINGKTYALKFYKKKDLKHFIGVSGWSYDLVIPQRHMKSKTLKKYLGEENVNKGIMSINVKEIDEGIKLSFPAFTLRLNVA